MLRSQQHLEQLDDKIFMMADKYHRQYSFFFAIIFFKMTVDQFASEQVVAISSRDLFDLEIASPRA